MSSLNVNNLTIPLDNDGYLENLEDWSPAVAKALAAEENLQLNDAHWELIHLTRDFYQDFELAPSQRPLIKYVKQRLGDDKGRSIYLMKLFPGSPAKLIARIAGLPRPTNCF